MGNKRPGTTAGLLESGRGTLSSAVCAPALSGTGASSGGRNPVLLACGEDAIKKAKYLLSRAPAVVRVPSSLGEVEMRPGMVFDEHKVLLHADWTWTYYLIDDRLYSFGTADFLRNEYLTAYAKGGASAAWLIPIAKAEMALLMGIFVPWYLLLGMTVARAALFYKANQKQVDAVMKAAPGVIEKLRKFQANHPELFKKICGTAAKEVLVNLPHGVTAEDVAFFIGRAIKGVAEAPEITLWIVLKIVTKVGAIVTATHLPAITAHAAAHAVGKQAEALRETLAKEGVTLTEEEARIILKQIAARKNALSELADLEKSLKEFIPLVESVRAAWQD